MPDNLYKRGGVWYGRVQVAGREHRRSLKTASKAEAKRRLMLMLAQLSPYHGTIRQGFTDVVDAALAEARPHLKAKTFERYLQSGVVLAGHFGDRFFDEIDKRAVQNFIAARKADGLAMRTIRNDLSVLSLASEYAIEQEWVGTNPVTQIGKRALRHKPPVFVLPPPEDIELALACVHGPLQALCRFLRHTGMRRDEAVTLTWSQVDMDRRSVTLPETKSGRTRTVSLNDEAVAVLKGRPIRGDLVFARTDGEPYRAASHGWRHGLARAREKRKSFRRFRLHDLRHIYAIEYLRGGGNIYALQKQLGHGSIAQTEHYLQYLTPEEQERAKSAQIPAQIHRFQLAGDRENV